MVGSLRNESRVMEVRIIGNVNANALQLGKSAEGWQGLSQWVGTLVDR
jgi:hypothetical protein